MSGPLNQLPPRVAIGTAKDASGQSVPVFITPEFARVLTTLIERVGGAVASSNDELAAETVFTASAAVGHGLALAVEDLQNQVTALTGQIAALAELGKALARAENRPTDGASVAALAELGKAVAQIKEEAIFAPPPTDWEHPGRIGAGKASSGRFTTVTAGDVSASGKFGCNGKAPQGPAVSGGTLAGVIAALVANGVLSS